MRPVVVLRPEPGASRTAARAEALGLDVRVLPLFAVVPIEWSAPNPSDFDGIVLTSANAVRHGGEQLEELKALPVHAVGEATAALARAAGFTIASVGSGGSRDMALPEGKRLLHLTGRDHIATAGHAIAVYEARKIEAPPGLAGLDGCVALVHSPRAGSRFAELVDRRRRIMIAAISPAAATAAGTGWERVHAAPMPSEAALLALAARLCESPGQ